MCGAYYLKIEEDELREILAEIEKQYTDVQIKTGEIFPKNIAPVLTLIENKVQPKPMIWGFPHWQSSNVIFNARAETALEKKMFREPLLHNPVVIPTSGFFEWKAVSGQKKKEKYLFRQPQEQVLYLAGFYDTFPDKENNRSERFTILTTNANDSLIEYHNRMPVLLRRNEIKSWLAGDQLTNYLTRIPDELDAQIAM